MCSYLIKACIWMFLTFHGQLNATILSNTLEFFQELDREETGVERIPKKGSLVVKSYKIRLSLQICPWDRKWITEIQFETLSANILICKNELVGEDDVALWVKLLLDTPTSHPGAPGQVPAFPLLIHLLQCAWAAGDDLSSWIATTRKQAQNKIPLSGSSLALFSCGSQRH